MVLLRAAVAAGAKTQASSLGPCLLHLLRRFASNSTKELVERTVIVDTLAQVRSQREQLAKSVQCIVRSLHP